jgi:hypothetical protein
VEGDHDSRALISRGWGSLLAVSVLTGALLATLVALTVGFGLAWLGGLLRHPEWAEAFRLFLAGGGWWLLSLWGGAAGAVLAGVRFASPMARAGALLGAAVLVALPLLIKAQFADDSTPRIPASSAGKRSAILRWSYRSLPGLRLTLDLARDPDSTVREQAVIALGRNLVVSDLERADAEHPARFENLPLRGALRDTLIEVLRGDSIEVLRVEAAHALWLAPRAFGPQPEAAETLAAVLSRRDSTSISAALARRALQMRPDSSRAGDAARL